MIYAILLIKMPPPPFDLHTKIPGSAPAWAVVHKCPVCVQFSSCRQAEWTHVQTSCYIFFLLSRFLRDCSLLYMTLRWAVTICDIRRKIQWKVSANATNPASNNSKSKGSKVNIYFDQFGVYVMLFQCYIVGKPTVQFLLLLLCMNIKLLICACIYYSDFILENSWYTHSLSR